MHVRGRLSHLRRERERGQILVLFALFLTVLMAMGSIVLDIGNWYALERHLQTQVDAAALAGGPAFTGCFQDPGATTTAIEEQALRYAGDPSRDASTHNPLMEDTVDVHAVLNSSTYWSNDDEPDGSDNDWTIGAPCDAGFLDVKATDDGAPLLWGWIPLFPDLHTRARVEISKIESTDGLRPLGVPEVDPEQVAVVFVNEDGNPNDANSVRGGAFLDPDSTPPTGLEGMAVWSKDSITPVGINGGENFGVVVVVSRSPNPISLTGTLSQICNQNPTQTQCYAGNTLESGASFIHAYSGSGNGIASAPIIRGVTLGGGCPDSLSAPYFNLAAGTDDDDDGTVETSELCPFQIYADIDFGTGTTNPELPVAQGGVCAVVDSDVGPLNWSGGVFTGGFTLGADSGANEIDVSWTTDTVGGCGGQGRRDGDFNKVAKPYVANDASGPVQYLNVELSSGGLANSMEKESSASLDVTVGFVAPLRDRPWTDLPMRLRVWDTPSQTQALDCGSGSGPNGWGGAMVNGCLDEYAPYDEAKHVSKCGPPPNGVPAADPPDCVSSQNGNYNQNAVINMLTPCAENLNNWDGTNKPPDSDKRWMPLFVVDELAFKQGGKKTYPIRRFGMFYVTALSGLNCPGDNPDFIPSNRREMWGHFITYITPGLGKTIPSVEPCSFTDGELCVSNLVE